MSIDKYKEYLIELKENEEELLSNVITDTELNELDTIDIQKFCNGLDSNINISDLDTFQWEYNYED